MVHGSSIGPSPKWQNYFKSYLSTFSSGQKKIIFPASSQYISLLLYDSNFYYLCSIVDLMPEKPNYSGTIRGKLRGRRSDTKLEGQFVVQKYLAPTGTEGEFKLVIMPLALELMDDPSKFYSTPLTEEEKKKLLNKEHRLMMYLGGSTTLECLLRYDSEELSKLESGQAEDILNKRKAERWIGTDDLGNNGRYATELKNITDLFLAQDDVTVEAVGIAPSEYGTKYNNRLDLLPEGLGLASSDIVLKATMDAGLSRRTLIVVLKKGDKTLCRLSLKYGPVNAAKLDGILYQIRKPETLNEDRKKLVRDMVNEVLNLAAYELATQADEALFSALNRYHLFNKQYPKLEEIENEFEEVITKK